MHDSLQAEAAKSSRVERTSGNDAFLQDVLDGLSLSQKQIPSKYFYDQRGSRLFDQICELEEYYPTRIETEIMERNGSEMADAISASRCLVEYGSGSSRKTDHLLRRLSDLDVYVPVDVSADHLEEVATRLRSRYERPAVSPLAVDFTELTELPHDLPSPRSVYFPGSTIGNFTHDDASMLLKRIASIIRPHGSLLLGVDLVKDPSILETAYNDRKGVTAEFNRNLLKRINDELGADFAVEKFQHLAIWNETSSRIEMHLRSESSQTVSIAGRKFRFSAGETILTEYSHKYDFAQIEAMANAAGLRQTQLWTDDQRWFAVILLDVITR